MHAGWSDGKSKAHSAVDLHSSVDTGSHESGPLHIGIPDLAESSTQGQTVAEPDADKENFHLPEVTYDIEDNGHLSDDSPEEAVAQDPPEQEEEWEDDEDDEDGEESEGQSLLLCVCVFFLFKTMRIRVKRVVLFSKFFRGPQQDSSICQREKEHYSP